MSDDIWDKDGIGLTLDVTTYKPTGKVYDGGTIENFDPRKRFDRDHIISKFKNEPIALPNNGYLIIRWDMENRGHEANLVGKHEDDIGHVFIHRLYKEEEIS